jgi:hypothetical protein
MIGVPGETEHRNQHQRAPCKVRTGGNEPEVRSVLPFWELMDIGSRCTRGCVHDRSAAFSRGGQWDMDLRPYLPSTDRVERAAGVLNYQPFMLSDDVQTGVAYSFVNGGDPRVSPPLLFRRRDFEDRWDAITDANARLRAMYDDLLDEVATLFPGGSLLDVACNNGYFPVGAELRGMRGTGMDLGNHSGAVSRST